jgi:hypothetical protein
MVVIKKIMAKWRDWVTGCISMTTIFVFVNQSSTNEFYTWFVA